MRLFVAVELDEPCKQALASAAYTLQRHAVSARIVPAHLAHLTLAFIGESPDVAKAQACLGTIQARGFELRLQGAGRFGGLRDAVVWVGICPGDALHALQGQVDKILRGAGFSIDAKRFQPHVTLARRAVFQNAEQFEAFKRALPRGPLCSMRAQAFSMMHSHREGGALVYTPVERWQLLPTK